MDALDQKKAELQAKLLQETQKHDESAKFLLKMGAVITFLLYLAFFQRLYLGDPTTWGAYFDTLSGTAGFLFMAGLGVLLALFLAWVKHHAYLHFGLYGSITAIAVTVIGFALFAELFSSSDSQDAKALIQLNNNKAYQSTLTSSTNTISSHFAADIAKAAQKLAQCEARLAQGNEKHCYGDKAALQALRDSEHATLSAQTNASVTAQEQTYKRQDQLKAESYNPTILFIAKALAALSGGDWMEYVKSAIVLVMFIIAAAFETLHNFLSRSKGQSTAAMEAIELQLARLTTNDRVHTPTHSPRHPIGFAPAQDNTTYAQSTVSAPRFEYEKREEKRNPMGFVWESENRVHTPTHTPITKPVGTAKPEEQLTMFSTYLGKVLTTGEPNTTEEVQAHIERAKQQAGYRVHTPTHTATRTPIDTASTYQDWLKAVHAGECKATVRDTRAWVQKRIAGKGSQAARRTSTPVDIDAITTSLFKRAVKDKASRIIENPNYSQGKPKYLLAEV